MRSLRRLGLLFAGGMALASRWPTPSSADDPDMNCAAARQLVGRAGASSLSTGPYTYDRYVRDRSFCQLGEILEPTWVPTRDVAQCPIGYRCRSGALDFND